MAPYLKEEARSAAESEDKEGTGRDYDAVTKEGGRMIWFGNYSVITWQHGAPTWGYWS